MHQIFDHILTNNYDELKFLNELLTKYNIRDMMLEQSKKIKTEHLYSSFFHGLHHSQKVYLFACLIASEMHVSAVEMQILTDAAFYHDIGRETDMEDPIHGLISANKIEKVLDNATYQDKKNIGYLKAVVDVHSRTTQNAMIETFENYKIDYPDMDYSVFERLANILMDADALDRTRFKKTCDAALREKYLRLDASRKIIVIAQMVNDFYAQRIDDLNAEKIRHVLESTPNKEKEFFHGIGWDFFALKNILELGILSNYEARKSKTIFLSNFNGNNNGNMWISVVDASINNGKAYTTFVANNLALLVSSANWIDGYQMSKAKAKDLGLSYFSREYIDEKFVFQKIEPEQIHGINLANNGCLKLNDLDYFNCSYNADTIRNKVLYYIGNLKRYCHYDADYETCTYYIYLLQSEVVNYEKMSYAEQKEYQMEFFAKSGRIIFLINKILQKWISEAFGKKLNINADEITVIDVVKSILAEQKMEYQVSSEGNFIFLNNKNKTNKTFSTQY